MLTKQKQTITVSFYSTLNLLAIKNTSGQGTLLKNEIIQQRRESEEIGTHYTFGGTGDQCKFKGYLTVSSKILSGIHLDKASRNLFYKTYSRATWKYAGSILNEENMMQIKAMISFKYILIYELKYLERDIFK